MDLHYTSVGDSGDPACKRTERTHQMLKEVDEMMQENESLKAENQRLMSLLDNAYHTIISMAEGIAMISHPNWTKLSIEQQQKVRQEIYGEWIERSINDKYRNQ